MKRFFVLALTLVLMLSLAACGNNDNTSSNNSSVSINAATPSDESSVSSQSSSVSSSTSTSVSLNTSSSTQDIQGTEMNLTQIQDGNYSSLLGTWTGVAYAANPHNGTRLQWQAGPRYNLSVSSDKIVLGNGDLVIQGNTLKDNAGSHTLNFYSNEDSLHASLTDQIVAINWALYFYPKGVKNDLNPNNGVKIDNTKNLIVIWTSNNGFTIVFARTNESNSVTNSSSKQPTPVSSPNLTESSKQTSPKNIEAIPTLGPQKTTNPTITPSTQNNEKESTEVTWYNKEIAYKAYTNGRFEFSIEYPSVFEIKMIPTNKDGVLLASPDGDCELTVSGINNVFNETVNAYFEKYEKVSGDAAYKKIESNWYVLSWVEGDKIIYKKVVVGSGSVNTFLIKYPAKQKEIYDPIINRLLSTFKTPGIDSIHGMF